MRLCQLNYRLKGTKEIRSLSFDSFEDANTHLVDSGLQCVVGRLKGVENPWVIYERAAENSKADWFEFNHVETE